MYVICNWLLLTKKERKKVFLTDDRRLATAGAGVGLRRRTIMHVEACKNETLSSNWKKVGRVANKCIVTLCQINFLVDLLNNFSVSR